MPNFDFSLPVNATTFAPILFIGSIILIISSELPLLEIIITMSPSSIIPKSPCIASAAFMNIVVVPVDDNVAAIFLPIIPDFPIPAITILFLLFVVSIIILANSVNLSSILFFNFSNSLISISKTFFASFNIFTLAIFYYSILYCCS